MRTITLDVLQPDAEGQILGVSPERRFDVVIQNAEPILSAEVKALFVVSSQGNDLPLAVESNGQTVFNVFTNPQKSILLVDGVEHYASRDYNITTTNGVKLNWIGNFSFEVGDHLIFRTF